MKFLLDTNVVSELRKGRNADAAVRNWASGIERRDTAISVVTLLELQQGILLARLRDAALSAQLANWLAVTVRPQFEGLILAIDEAVALRCAELQVPNRRPLADAFIAATALVHDLTVVTRNIVDFDGTGARLLDPWTT